MYHEEVLYRNHRLFGLVRPKILYEGNALHLDWTCNDAITAPSAVWASHPQHCPK